MKREYHKWWSPALGREMELLVFGHAGARVMVFPTRCGRFFDYENFGLVGAISHLICAGHLQLYCVDSVDAESFYATWKRREDRIHRHNQYETYLLNEVVPLSEVINPGSFLMTHGCSLGAYHAVNVALRHPRLFRKTVAFSGRYDLTVPVDKFRDLFDGHFDTDVYYHMPTRYVPHIAEGEYLQSLREVEVVISSGESDPFLTSAVELDAGLRNKGVRCDLHVWPGRAHHCGPWKEMARAYL